MTAAAQPCRAEPTRSRRHSGGTKIPADQRAQIVAALLAGETCDVVAQRFGRPTNTIVDVAKRHEIRPKRTRKDPDGRSTAMREAMDRNRDIADLRGRYAHKTDPWRARFKDVPEAGAAYFAGLRRLEAMR